MKSSTKSSSGSVNYAKRGWMWLGGTALVYIFYWIAAFLASQYWKQEAFGLVIVLSIYASIATTMLSLYYFLQAAKNNGLFYLVGLVDLALIVFLIWLSLLARSY